MTREERPIARIIITLPSGEEVTQLLTAATVSIGRGAGNTVQVDDPRVSRHHARVTATDRTFLVTDLGSRNGISFRNERVAAITVAEHETVAVGDSRFRLEWVADPAQEEGDRPRLAWRPGKDEDMAAENTRSVARFALAASGIGGLLAVAGSSLTWGEADIPIIGTVTRSGMDEGRSGPVTLALGAVLVLLALTTAWRPFLATRATIGAVLAVVVLVVAFRDAQELQDGSAFVERITFGTATTSMGEGLALVFAGGAVALLASLAALAADLWQRRSTPTPPPALQADAEGLGESNE